MYKSKKIFEHFISSMTSLLNGDELVACSYLVLSKRGEQDKKGKRSPFRGSARFFESLFRTRQYGQSLDLTRP